jgi:hypothetical protein
MINWRPLHEIKNFRDVLLLHIDGLKFWFDDDFGEWKCMADWNCDTSKIQFQCGIPSIYLDRRQHHLSASEVIANEFHKSVWRIA